MGRTVLVLLSNPFTKRIERGHVMLDAAGKTRRARIAAHTMHAQGKTNTAPARAALDKKFLDQVDPDRTLPEPERAKRALHARSAFYVRLAHESAQRRAAAANR
jgi:hypothetical protein